MDDLLQIAVEACRIALSAGAEFAEVHVGRGRSFSTALERGAIKTSQAREYGGVSVRAFHRGGVGRSHANVLDPARVREAAETAAALARQADADRDFVALPYPQPLPTVAGLYDDRLAGLSVTDATRLALAGVDEALAAVPDAIIGGGMGVSVGDHALANSVGVQVASQRSHIGLGLEAVIKRGDNVGI